MVAERKLLCSPPRYESGDGGINVSRAIRKLGGKSAALYLSGGPTGKTLRDLLDQEGLDPLSVSTKGWTPESFAVLGESTGQQFRFNIPGPALLDDPPPDAYRDFPRLESGARRWPSCRSVWGRSRQSLASIWRSVIMNLSSKWHDNRSVTAATPGCSGTPAARGAFGSGKLGVRRASFSRSA
jgi:hypothetical protein